MSAANSQSGRVDSSCMPAVFYDLETSDRNQIGQILNYSFILVDQGQNQVGELSGLIKLSRLQIPDPGAILANRTDVIEHQLIATDFEPQAMIKIGQFLESCISKACGAVALIGYNSSRFDLNYLRTSFIRNGINPYFNNQIVSRDLLHVAQRAYLISEVFRELIVSQRKDDKKLSLSLETVGHALGLLTGVQAHESREDVVLTIRVAEWFRQECGLDVTTFDGYQGSRLHSTARSGSVYFQERPEYDLSLNAYSVKTPVTLLDANNRAGLWIDLERYMAKQSPECIMWRSAGKHAFFVAPQASQDPELQRVARAALAQFKGINLKNYFSKSTCDIEMDIYRIDFDTLDLYAQAVRENNRRILDDCVNPDAKKLWIRRQLANPAANVANPQTADILRKYAIYRYGGQLQLAKSVDIERKSEGAYHNTLGEMMRQLMLSREAAIINKNSEDQRLLDSLEKFVRQSDIARVVGAELVPMWALEGHGS